MKTPRELGLPYDSWRPGQRLAARTALHAKVPHIVINAPTGSGKSTVAAMLTRLDSRRQAVLTATKALMQQYSGTFPFLYDVRGMSNYDCLAAKDEFRSWFPLQRRAVKCDDGPCHEGAKCTLKEGGCTYFDAYRSALGAQALLTNYAYWCSMRRFGKGLGVAQRLICDEAHALPEQLMSACRIEIPRGLLDAAVPRGYLQWRRWAERQLEDFAPGGDDDQRVRRSKLVERLKALATIDDTWAWDEDRDAIVFEPTIPRLLMPLLQTFDAHTSVVYLSATITPAMLRLLDVPDDQVEYVELPSTFDVAKRPIYLVPGARVDYRTMKDANTVQGWIDAMQAICEKREDRHGLIHSVSFARAQDIGEGLRGRTGHILFVHRSGQAAADVVAAFKQHVREGGAPAILISPSIMTGFDFPYREAEFQIVAKVPFPDTRSNIVKARMRATEGYRDHLTMQQLVQACGRIVRASDDQGETFIVDEHARWFLKKYAELAPRWFLDAVIETRRTAIKPPLALA